MPAAVPFAEIDTVFLDAGNTLVSIDFDRVSSELTRRGVSCESHGLRRAEAAARPRVSARAHEQQGTEGDDAFTAYLAFVFEGLLGEGDRAEAIAREIGPVLREPGASDRLWCWVLPGTRDALLRLRAQGLRLVVVSNADGSAERGLEARGLRPLLDHVIDSHEVGFEKPDPRIFDAALARAGARPERTLHVGDLYHADVLGARARGIHATLLDPFDDWGELDCLRVADLLELAAHFEEARR